MVLPKNCKKILYFQTGPAYVACYSVFAASVSPFFWNKIKGTNCAYSFDNGHVCSPSADSLTVDSLLELLDEESLRKDTALPSPGWSSDHIALLAEFRCKPRIRS